MTVTRRPAFFRDLQKYAARIARDNPDAARRLLSAAEEACDFIGKNPGIGSQEKFRKHVGIRSWRISGFENYLIFYKTNETSVDILRLIHGARNLPVFFRFLDGNDGR